MVMSTLSPLPRNPGPSWGYGFLLWAEHRWPRWFFRPMLMAGTWVALAFMPGPRAHSRAYLTVALGRPARLTEVWRHFLAFADSLLLMLRAGRGLPVRCSLEPEHAAAFESLVRSGRPALFGSFHFGNSDLLGYLLSERERRVTILRQQVGNSTDTRRLGARFGARVSFLWVNDPVALLFDLKAALEAGDSLALKCDRLEFSAKCEPFRFLGAERLFPFTVYHLALLFHRPVVFCTAVPGAGADELRVFASPVSTPDPAAGRTTNTQAARGHFQAVLTHLEILVRRHPLLWFNFIPLNPVAPAAAVPLTPLPAAFNSPPPRNPSGCTAAEFAGPRPAAL
jgi:predicted LPLAT superfamily acyltransferase